jgi:hypothetical protein
LRKGLFLGILGLVFLLLYVVNLNFDDLQTDIPVALLSLLALAAVDILLLTEDPLQYSRATDNRHISFYQEQFPRKYIQQRHGLTAPEARQRWLSVLRQWRDKSHPCHLYYMSLLRTRYECRMVFNLQRVLIWLSSLSFIGLLVLAGLSWWDGMDLPVYYSFENPALIAARIVFPFLLFGLYMYLRAVNIPDTDNPTGAWRRWKEINDELKTWWDQNEVAEGSV